MLHSACNIPLLAGESCFSSCYQYWEYTGNEIIKQTRILNVCLHGENGTQWYMCSMLQRSWTCLSKLPVILFIHFPRRRHLILFRGLLINHVSRNITNSVPVYIVEYIDVSLMVKGWHVNNQQNSWAKMLRLSLIDYLNFLNGK